MSIEYRIADESSGQETVTKEILAELLRYNASQAGPLNDRKLVLSVRAADDALLGGLVGVQYWNGMFIDLVWVHERHGVAASGQSS